MSLTCLVSLRLHSADMPLEATVNLDAIAGRTNGYSGADLCALCRETAMHAISCVPFASSGVHLNCGFNECGLLQGISHT